VVGFQYQIKQDGTKTTSLTPSGWGTAPISCWVTKLGGEC